MPGRDIICMKILRNNDKLNSVSFKLISIIAALVIPLIGLLIYNNVYAIRVIQKQVAEANKNMIALYMAQIDSNLEVIDNYLLDVAATNSDFINIALETDQERIAISKRSLLNQIQQDIISLENIDAIFFFNDNSNRIIYGHSVSGSLEEREAVSDYLINRLDQLAQNNNEHNWSVAQVGNEFYLVHVLKRNHATLGAWLNIKRLMSPLSLIDLGENGVSVLTTLNGNPMATSGPVPDGQVAYQPSMQSYYMTGSKNQYLAVVQQSNTGEFCLAALIPNKVVLERLPYMQYIVNAIAVCYILIFAYCLVLIRQIIIVPLNKIMAMTRNIKNGIIESRIRPSPVSTEFQAVNEALNSMLDEIHHLKINVYEEQLGKQKVELEHLQLQVKPHFFLNALSILHSMARLKQNELVEDLSICLIRYFRYIFRSNTNFVSLEDEIAHVRNYMRIQGVRYQQLQFEIEAADYLLQTPVPPLIIQTFAENSIKHAMDLAQPMMIKVQVSPITINNTDCIKIIISDSGTGFPPIILEQLQNNQLIVDDHGERHVGIWNLHRRLQLLYPDKAHLEISNTRTGALIEIFLPRWPKEVDPS